MSVMRLLNLLLHPIGLEMRRLANIPGIPTCDPTDCYLETPELHDRLIDELSEQCLLFIYENLPVKGSQEDVKAQCNRVIRDFFDIYRNRTVLNNLGGSGFNNSFWLYITHRLLDPKLVVESGIWKGHSSWLLRQACPDAEIHGFDISLRMLAHRTPMNFYHEADWNTHSFGKVDPESSLCFFDCHINHAQRIREAYDKGFRRLIIDDNPPAHKLHRFGLPGTPTVAMLMDERVNPGDTFRWVWRGQQKSYTYQPGDDHGARELIQRYAVFPDLTTTTMYGAGSYTMLCYVELVD